MGDNIAFSIAFTRYFRCSEPCQLAAMPDARHSAQPAAQTAAQFGCPAGCTFGGCRPVLNRQPCRHPCSWQPPDADSLLPSAVAVRRVGGPSFLSLFRLHSNTERMTNMHFSRVGMNGREATLHLDTYSTSGNAPPRPFTRMSKATLDTLVRMRSQSLHVHERDHEILRPFMSVIMLIPHHDCRCSADSGRKRLLENFECPRRIVAY